MSEYDIVSGMTGSGQTVEVDHCFGCPFAVSDVDKWGYASGYQCGFDGVQETGRPDPPPDSCPLRASVYTVQLSAKAERQGGS